MNSRTQRTRRQFIKQTLAASAALGTATACRQLGMAKRTEADPNTLKKFGANLKGRLILPTDAAYEKARRVYFWNPQTERRPVAVVRCAHADDVLRTVEFARAHALEIAVRAGGHSMQGWSTSDGLVIDLSGMKQVAIDSARRVGRVGAGVLSGEFVWSAAPHGLAPVLGQCPGVGVSGVTLGGGLGWLSGLHGAACDNLLGARIVTADGRILSMDTTNNPDLFWAIRGGSGNFGVVTSFDCALHSIGPVTAGEIHYPFRDTRTVLRFFRDWMADAPDSFQATVHLVPGDGTIFVGLCYAGEASEANRLLQAFRTVATPAKDTVKRQSYADLAGRSPSNKVDDSTPLSFSCNRGLYLKRLSDETIEGTIEVLGTAPAGTAMGISHYMHGAVCRAQPETTAFSLRESGAIHIRIGVEWTDAAAADRCLAWADKAWRLLRPASDERIYANYQTYEGSGASEAVFGGNHARLAVLKKKYDPTNFFRRNSNIKPSTG